MASRSGRAPAEMAFPLDRRVGKQTATAVEKHLGLRTVGELLNYFPRAHLRRGELTPIAELNTTRTSLRDPAADAEEVTLLARVHSNTMRQMHKRKGSLTEIVIADGSGDPLGMMQITFFNGYQAHKDLRVGTQAMFSGKITTFQKKLTLTNPHYALLEEDLADQERLALEPIPIYPATAKLTSMKIKGFLDTLLASVDFDVVPDPLPDHVRRREGLMSLEDAYRQFHRPRLFEEIEPAKKRFRYQEALILQSALARRRHAAAGEEATARVATDEGLLAQFDAQLPFTLTAGQDDVGEQLAAELAADSPMNRLLQGEVGSGKTIVALRAMLQVIDAGGQAALLAPTEVLAAQHYLSIKRVLGPLAEGGMLGGSTVGTQVRLLTGSMSQAARTQSMLDAVTGEAGIVIGTHALLAEKVQFFDLGLIVVDEQHRFGVEQRDALRAKANKPPHLLVMTATPIPRTVAMTVFGDLDTSVLTELPAGRSPISTHQVGLAEHPDWENRIWARAREEIDAGRQVYVVCPKIGDAEGDGDEGLETDTEPTSKPLASVLQVAEYLSTVPALAGVRTGILHGRLDSEEKAETMAAFNAGTINLLVSTTVIEVGVDVANATLMVILDADRFGISQLHQLRGRVGRGSEPGTCLLVTRLEPEHPSRSRLDVVASTTDGFELSQEDLKLRREGDILGASQSGGRSALKVLRVLKDEKIIERARADAQHIIAADPLLAEFPALDEAIEQYLNPDAEAFLERG